jgi:hypothetical protein
MKISQSSPATEWRPKVAHDETVGFGSKINRVPDGAKEMNRGLIFCRPCRGWLRFVVLPTVSPWATFWRASGALAAMILFFAAGATAETTNTLSDAGIQGRNLAQQLLQQSPATNFSQNGVLKIRDVKGTTTNIPVSFRTFVATGSWQTSYFSMQTNDYGFPWIKLDIIHRNDEPNEYDISED